MSESSDAIVFAYHDVGVRCLSVLLAHGVRIPLVVTHKDDPNESIWFESVAKLARAHGAKGAKPRLRRGPRRRLQKAIARRRRKLRARALRDGRRLYSRRPAKFLRRIRERGR